MGGQDRGRLHLTRRTPPRRPRRDTLPAERAWHAALQSPLEEGWPFQRFTLRERGVVVAGPDPRTLADPVARQEMRSAVAAIAGMWAEQAARDPSWLEWLRQRDSQVFVVLTLCRMLYSLATGSVASKPQAAAWAMRELGEPWAALIKGSLTQQHKAEEVAQHEVAQTVALVQLTLELSSSPDV